MSKNSTLNEATSARQPSARPVWRSWWWIAGAGLLVLSTPFLFSRPANARHEEQKARRQKIENLSAAERERLERNFEQFEKLPAQQKAELRLLDEAVQNDQGLKNTLNEYESWLTTLSPWERADLRKAKTNKEKLEVVETIVAEQRQQAEERRQQELEYQKQIKENLAKFQGPRPQGVRLTDEELSRMLAVLDSHVGPGFHQHPHKPPGSPAYQMQLLASVLEDRYLNHNEEAHDQPLPAKLIEEMIAQVSDSKARDQVQKLYDEKHARGFVGYVAWKLNMAWWHEAWENYPSRFELEKIAKLLGGKALETFENEKQENPGRAYVRLFITSHQSQLANKDAAKLYDILDKLDLRPSQRRPSEGPNGGRFGERRGGGQRRDGGRGPDRNGERGPRREFGPPNKDRGGPAESPPPNRGEDPNPSKTDTIDES